eukprot:6094787-Alexandrium_andersonii.AAC.1
METVLCVMRAQCLARLRSSCTRPELVQLALLNPGHFLEEPRGSACQERHPEQLAHRLGTDCARQSHASIVATMRSP